MMSYQQRFNISIAIFVAFQSDCNEEDQGQQELSKNLRRFETCCDTIQGNGGFNQSGMAEQVQKYWGCVEQPLFPGIC
jgi:hypothetical protein